MKGAAAVAAPGPTTSGSELKPDPIGADHRAIAFDQRQRLAGLPDREGVAFRKRDFQLARIDLAHFRRFDPGQVLQRLARFAQVERRQRREAVEAERLENRDLRRVLVAR
jgi:hypothetical protein